MADRVQVAQLLGVHNVQFAFVSDDPHAPEIDDGHISSVFTHLYGCLPATKLPGYGRGSRDMAWKRVYLAFYARQREKCKGRP
jgi:hypothetical protein